MTFEQLAKAEEFTRKDYYDAERDRTGIQSPYALDYALRKSISQGSIIHIGRNRYTIAESKQIYTHKYSFEACQIAEEIQEEYPAVDFQIFELRQLNTLVNHMIAHNTIFVSVENDAIDYVFDSLRTKHPGKVMLKPKLEEYYRYLVDNQIVILRLPTETPKSAGISWHSRLEKILVDITVDKLLSQLVSEGEYRSIFSQAYEHYFLDTGAMLRYANRKGAGKRFQNFLQSIS